MILSGFPKSLIGTKLLFNLYTFGPLVLVTCALNTNALPLHLSTDLRSRDVLQDTGSPYTPVVKGVVTVLALLASILITATYITLITASARMTSTSLYPLRSIAHNVGTLLTEAWPDHGQPKYQKRGYSKEQPIVLFYMGRMTGEGNKRKAKGVLDTKGVTDANTESHDQTDRQTWLTSGSLLTRSILQLAVWEWVTLWLSIMMIFSTLLFNGVFSDHLGPDGWPRIAVVIIYTAAYCFHAYFVWSSFVQFLSMVATGAAWSLLHSANFAVASVAQIADHIQNPAQTVGFLMIDKASKEYIPTSYDGEFATQHDTNSDETPSASNAAVTTAVTTAVTVDNKERLEELTNALASIKTVQGNARDAATSAIETATDRVTTNGMLMTSVILTTGFIVWTSSTPSATETQLGSLGLLASLTLGISAMYTSVVQLGVLNSSYEEILKLKEITINGHAVEYIQKREPTEHAIGFTYGTASKDILKFKDIFQLTETKRLLLLLLFGPAYALLPSEAEHRRKDSKAALHMETKVGERRVVFTNNKTTNEGGHLVRNVDPICVRYIPSDSDPERSSEELARSGE